MNVYVYKAVLLCSNCAEERMEYRKARNGEQPCEDSNHWPQGPYPDGGGEADTPQCCDYCNIFLENPLTSAGEQYIYDAVVASLRSDKCDRNVLAQWADHYDYLLEYRWL